MIKRVVSTTFWTDDKVINSFSPKDKYFMLYLLTNPHTTQLGIYPLNERMAAFELGYSVESIKVLLDRFESKYGIIKRSDSTSEIAIKNYLCYSVVKGGKPVEDCLKKELREVKDKKLAYYLGDYLSKKTDLVPTVEKFVKENLHFSSNENDNENDNENENENEVSSTLRPPYADRTSNVRDVKNDGKSFRGDQDFNPDDKQIYEIY